MIFSNINFDDFFDKWFDEYESSDNFEDYMWWKMDEDIEEFKEENPNLNDKEIEKWKSKELKKHAKVWYDNHVSDWEDAFDKSREEGEFIYVYRSITVKNINQFVSLLKKNEFEKDYNGIGIYWSWIKDKADSHWGCFTGEEKEILITAKAHHSVIDIDTTLMLNFCPCLGLDEVELRLLEGHSIFVEQIEYGETIININKEVDL